MPIEFVNQDEGRGNIIIGSGILTGKEYIEAFKRHLEQGKEKLKKHRYSLTDLTSVTKIEGFPNSVIKESVLLCEQMAQINADIVVATAAEKTIMFGLSRMWEILMDETTWDIMVFNTRDAAEKWIKETVKNKFGIEDLTIGST
jgi:deoxyhypusine synthase